MVLLGLKLEQLPKRCSGECGMIDENHYAGTQHLAVNGLLKQGEPLHWICVHCVSTLELSLVQIL